MKKVKIYKLIDPFTNEIRYIGKTEVSLNRRLSLHLTSSKRNKNKTHKEAWIISLVKRNSKPIIELIEEVDFEEWEDREIYWINQYSNLTNTAPGGQGGTGRVYTESERFEKSILMKKLIQEGKIDYKERAKKISESHKGKKLKQETKDKLRLANLGKKQSLKQKMKTSKPVIREDKEGNKVEFYSLNEAARQTCGKLDGNISSACTGRLKTYKGYKWYFKNKDIVDTI